MVKKKKNSMAGKIKFGTLMAAAAGAYYLFGTKEGAKKQKQVKSWALKMKGDVLEKLEQFDNGASEKMYHEAVDMTAKKYKQLKNVDPKELKATINDIKRHWKNISKDMEKATAPKKKSVKKVKKAKKAKK